MAYTMRTYVAEVKQRLDRFEVADKFDDGFLESLVNSCRHDVQRATLQIYQERFARIWVNPNAPTLSDDESAMFEDSSAGALRQTPSLIYTFDLPEDFIQVVDVAVVTNEDAYVARSVSKRELFSALTRTFTVPTYLDPLYCIERFINSPTYRLLVSAGDAVLGPNDVQVWYLAKLPYMELTNGAANGTDTEVRLGYDLQELVVMMTVMRALESAMVPQSRQIIANDIALALAMIESQYETQIDRTLLLTQARESAIINKPIA